MEKTKLEGESGGACGLCLAKSQQKQTYELFGLRVFVDWVVGNGNADADAGLFGLLCGLQSRVGKVGVRLVEGLGALLLNSRWEGAAVVAGYPAPRG